VCCGFVWLGWFWCCYRCGVPGDVPTFWCVVADFGLGGCRFLRILCILCLTLDFGLCFVLELRGFEVLGGSCILLFCIYIDYQ
jgi:hypothetical protein